MSANLFFNQIWTPCLTLHGDLLMHTLLRINDKNLSSSQTMLETGMHSSVLTFSSMCHMLLLSHLIRPYKWSGCHGWHRYEVHTRAEFVPVLPPCLHCDCHPFWTVMGWGWKACECHADPWEFITSWQRLVSHLRITSAVNAINHALAYVGYRTGKRIQFDWLADIYVWSHTTNSQSVPAY